MAAINWDDPAVKAANEDMNSVLVQRLHPEALRIDGSGGDGGRDVQLRNDDGLVIFQLKNFTGRLAQGGRKKQIVKSLAKAATHDPVRWELVVPIDPTPAELEWFVTQAEQYEFPCLWRGRTWLDGEHAQRPDIHRYFVEGAADEVIAVLQSINALDSTDPITLLGTFSGLRSRLNEVDPHYEFDLAVGTPPDAPPPGVVWMAREGDTCVMARPRYRGALQDRPINLTVTLQGSPDEVAEWVDGIRYGDPVTVPAGGAVISDYEGPELLAPQAGPCEIRLNAPTRALEEHVPVSLEVWDPTSEHRLAAVDVPVTEVRRGVDGLVATGATGGGLLSIEMRLTKNGEMRFKATVSQSTIGAAEGLDLAEFLVLVRPPNRLAVRPAGVPDHPDPVPIEDPLVDARIVDLFRAVLTVQQHTRHRFDVPSDMTANEWDEFLTAAAWLSPEGRSVAWSDWTLRLTSDAPDEVIERTREPGAYVIEADTTMSFRGRELQLGVLRRAFRAQTREVTVDPGTGDLDLSVEPINGEPMVERIVHERVLP